MSEKPISSASPESPDDNGEAAGRDGETIPDSEVPTLPDVSRPGDTRGSANCPTCGAEIPPEAPRGLCPKCALAGAAIPTDVDSAGGRSRSGPRFEPPALETIAAAFPQLELVELIGCGGMGAVYKARQPHLDRFVALKILPPSLAETPSFTERFTREGRLLAKLSHPAIVGVHDFGQAGGFFYLLMEYVDGVNLRQAMRAGRFTPEQALGIVPKVCEALQFAHDAGVLRRDIKPENILLDAKGAVKIADFGIAKLLDEAAGDDPALTGSMAPGTPHYMAPEQIEHPGEVDHRADIYSLGVVFYEMLTGELPIGRFAAPSEKSAVDSQVDEIVFRSLEKERDRRQQSANEVKTQIEGMSVAAIAAERHPGYAIPAGGKAAAVRSSGGRKAAALVLAGLLFPLVLTLIFFVANAQQQEKAVVQLERAEKARTEAARQMVGAKEEIDRLERELSELTDPSERDIKRRLIEEKKQAVERESVIAVTVRRSTASEAFSTSMFLLLPLLSILGFGIPATLMGWKSLRRIRALRLPEGRAAPMFAALFLPLLLLTVLVFALVALPMSYGPRWVGALGISLSVIASVAAVIWIIRAVLRWMNSEPAAAERAAVLADFERPRNPWVGWLIWLALIFLAVPFILISIWQVRSTGGGGVIPGFFELVIIAAIVGFFVFIIRLLVKRSRPAAEPVGAEVRRDLSVNPWPRRVFWLLIVIFVGPVLLIVIGLIIPYFSLEKPRARSHSVRIASAVENNGSVTVGLETRRYTAGNVNFKVNYEGPDLPEGNLNDHDRMYPGQGQEWDLYGDQQRRNDVIEFVLPDRRTAELAGQAVLIAVRNQRVHADVRRLDLFDVPAPGGGRYHAWVEMDSAKSGEAGSRPESSIGAPE